MTLKVIKDIDAILSEITGLQSDHVARICARCEDQCCKKVHYLFCEKDILYLRLSGIEVMWRREAFTRKGCWFLGPEGCCLDLKTRPFICHRYICQALEDEMEKCQPGIMKVLNEKFRLVDEMRSELWSQYLDAVR